MKVPEAEIDVNLPKGDISLPEGAVEIKGPEVDIKGPKIEAEVKDKDIDIEGSHGKFKMPSFKMPKFGFSTPKVKAEAPEVSTDISIPDIDAPSGKVGVDIEAPRVDVEKPDSKFQMPKVKMLDMDISLPRVKGPEIDIQQPKAQADVSISKPDLDVKGPEVDLKSPSTPKTSRIHLPTFGDLLKGFDLEFHVPSLDAEDQLVSPQADIFHSRVNKGDNEGSSVLTVDQKEQISADVILPNLQTGDLGAKECIEATSETKETDIPHKKERFGKSRFRFPKLGFGDSSHEDSKTENTSLISGATEKPLVTPEKAETIGIETSAKTDKGSWFKFPKLGISSPSKTAKDPDDQVIQPCGDTGDTEGDTSLTSSLKSSDAYADVSSEMTNEQIAPSGASPTKCRVKYSEPTVMTAGSVLKSPSHIITSTARTELILLEPHLPEKMDTATSPPSATVISSLQDTSKVPAWLNPLSKTAEDITSRKQEISTTETSTVQTLPIQKVTVKAGSAPWTTNQSAKSITEPPKTHMSVEKHIVKEKSGNEKETVVITQRTEQHQTAEGSTELITEGTASAIKKLRDTMHSEKMKFFEGAEKPTTSVSSHTSEEGELNKNASAESK
nr:PREDICTED: neuroblast differentiation-associated protein AHNAK-like [Lepisosteus oculatus]